MKEITDYEKVFWNIVKKTENYICDNNLKCMVLGISGGIDSTVVAAICHEVSKRTGVLFIGRSLPTKHNKEGETTTADLVGKAFCNNYRVCPIQELYEDFVVQIRNCENALGIWSGSDKQTPIANGNIQARLRMIYLYNLASIHKGLVMDTDNLTENNLGYFTIHGDVGDFNPIGGLWKTEVFKLAEWLMESYQRLSAKNDNYDEVVESTTKNSYYHKFQAIKESLKLKPTAGLGIADSDLDEIGAESYEQVDYILQEILAWKHTPNKGISLFKSDLEWFLEEQQILNIPYEIVEAVAKRHFASEFKRKQLPIKIPRYEILLQSDSE